MKKFVITIVFTSILLLMPISSSLEILIMQNNEAEQTFLEPLKIKLTRDEVRKINEIILEVEDNVYRNEAIEIIGYILSNDGALNINKFGNILHNYGFENFYNVADTTNPLDDFFDTIFELIVEILGWVDDLFEKTSNLIYDAQSLWQDRTLPQEIRNEIGNLANKLSDLENLLTLLAEGKYLRFLREWSPAIMIQDIIAIVTSLGAIANDLGIIVGDIFNFINDVRDMVTWLSEDPWTNQIHIYGQVMKNIFNGYDNVTVSCRGKICQTDEDGYFSFYVNSTPSDESIPQNEWYGIHKCVITAEKDGVAISSPDNLSYVFSGGELHWTFLFSNDDSLKELKTKTVHSLFLQYLENHPNLFPLLRQILGI